MVPDVLLVNAQHREEHVEEVTWKTKHELRIFLQGNQSATTAQAVRWRLHNTNHGD